MSCLAIIGVPRTDYTLEESVVQARLHGRDVVLVDRPAALAEVGSRVPVSATIPVDDLRADLVVAALRAVAPAVVLSFSELHLVLAARVRDALGLDGERVAVEERVRDKASTRARLREHGLSGVDFERTDLANLTATAARFTPPFVVKPTDMTGSIGVLAVRETADVDGYWELFADARTEERHEREFLVEDYITGVEYSVEGVCLDGRFHLLSVTEKATSGFPAFFEVGHLLPARQPDLAERLAPFVDAVGRALEIRTAPIHAEVKVSADRVELIEIHTRFGGDLIPLLIERAFGIKPFAVFYDALLYGTPPPPVAAHSVAGVTFLHESQPTPAIVPPARHGLDYSVFVRPGSAHDPPALDNIRIVNRRIGHVVFTVDGYGAAETFVAALSTPEVRA